MLTFRTLLGGTAFISLIAFVQPAFAEDPVTKAKTAIEDHQAAAKAKDLADDKAARAKMPPHEKAAVANAAPNRAEAQIAELHDKLHITPEQKDKWDAVAEAMRGSAKDMRDKLTDKAEKVKTKQMSAVDELHAYRDLAQTQADGLKRFIPPFEALYEVMSPAQKKGADEVFEEPRATTKVVAKSP